MKALKTGIRAALLLVLIGLTGCSTIQKKTVILHPIEKTDIFAVDKGSKIYSNDGSTFISVEKDGYFLSDYYVEEVTKAKIGQ